MRRGRKAAPFLVLETYIMSDSVPPSSNRTTKAFFSTLPGILAALAALITALVSLASSCSSSNKALVDKIDKSTQVCEDKISLERSARAAADDDIKSKQSDLKGVIQDNRDLTFEYYRKLESRVENMEPLAKKKH
jgi:hypothetical protein